MKKEKNEKKFPLYSAKFALTYNATNLSHLEILKEIK